MRQHHQCKGDEFEQTPGDSEEWGSLVCYSPWGRKESDMIQQLNNNSLKSGDCPKFLNFKRLTLGQHCCQLFPSLLPSNTRERSDSGSSLSCLLSRTISGAWETNVRVFTGKSWHPWSKNDRQLLEIKEDENVKTNDMAFVLSCLLINGKGYHCEICTFQ